MTQKIPHIARTMTAIAAVVAFTSPALAQDTSTPEPVVDTGATPAPDPLAPAPPEATSIAADTAVPPAPKPKVETSRASAAVATTARRSAGSAARPTTQRPARAAVMAAATVPPAPAAEAPPARPPTAAVEQAAPPIAEPAPAAEPADTVTTGLVADDMVAIGAAALALLALGATALAMHRRTRRREEAEYEARQQALAALEEETPVLDLDRRSEVRPGPAFARPATPVHDPVPDRSAAAGSGDFMFRRAYQAEKEKTDHS